MVNRLRLFVRSALMSPEFSTYREYSLSNTSIPCKSVIVILVILIFLTAIHSARER